jgi:uncharacterized phage infection (PIP) family protein YhgE
MAFEGLSVNVSGDSASAVASLQNLKASLTGAERGANDAADSVEELGDKASSTAGQLGVLSSAAATSSGSMSGLDSKTSSIGSSLTSIAGTTGTVAAGLTAVGTAAAPLAATLGGVTAAATGLAGAFGAVVGSGLLAFGQKRGEQNEERLEQIQSRIEELETLKENQGELTEAQQEELETLEEQEEKYSDLTGVTGGLKDAFGELQDELAPIILGFGEQFVPLIEDAFDAIPTLAENIVDALGPMDAFKEALADAGAAAMEIIPAVVSALSDLARDSLPALEDFAGFAADNATPAFEAMIDTTATLADGFIEFGDALADVAPTFLDVGTAVLDDLLPALADLTDGFGDLLEGAQDLGQSDVVQDFIKTATDGVEDLKDTVVGSEIFASVRETAKNDLRAASSIVEDVANGEFDSAMGTFVTRAEDRVEEIVTLLAGSNGSGGLINNAVNDLGSWLSSGGSTVIENGMDEIRQSTESVITDLRVAIAGPNGNSGVINNAIDELGGWLSGSGTSVIKAGFEDIEQATDSVLTNTRIAIAGTDGNGGIINNAINEIGAFLDSSGAAIMESGFETMMSNAESVVENTKITLIGSSGSGGIFNNLVGEISSFLKNGGADMVEASFRAIGESMSFVARDLVASLAGDEDAVLRNIVISFVNYLKNDAPGDLKTAIGIAFDVVVSAADGLLAGLVGNEDATLTNIVTDFAGYLRNTAPGELSSAIGDALGSVASTAETLAGTIGSNMIGGIQTAVASASDIASTVTSFVSESIPNGQQITATVSAVGDNIVDGIASGISGGGAILADIIGVVQAGVPNVQQIKSTVAGVGSNVVDAIASTITSAPGAIKSAIVGLINDAISSLNNAISNTVGEDIIPSVQVIPGSIGVNDPFSKGTINVNIPGGPMHSPEVDAPQFPTLDTGGRVEESGMATIHEGERVVPAAQISDRGEASFDPASVASGFDDSMVAQQLVAKLDELIGLIDGLEMTGRPITLRELSRETDRRNVKL